MRIIIITLSLMCIYIFILIVNHENAYNKLKIYKNYLSFIYYKSLKILLVL